MEQSQKITIFKADATHQFETNYALDRTGIQIRSGLDRTGIQIRSGLDRTGIQIRKLWKVTLPIITGVVWKLFLPAVYAVDRVLPDIY